MMSHYRIRGNEKMNKSQAINELDAVVIGAGFAGLYMLHRLREAGFSTQVYDAAPDVGGVWYVNRYPGARCDVESIYYCYSFSEELYKEWTWSSKFAGQPEILRYLNYVADKFDLRKDIQFNTKVKSARYDEYINKWKIKLSDGTSVTTKYFISAAGGLSVSNVPKFKGLENFKGEWYHTGNWPHQQIDFKGKRVGVIGTGSSGVQVIPIVAKEAEHLTVFQRTPAYAVPARNHQLDSDYIKHVKENFNENKHLARKTFTASPYPDSEQSALDVTSEERQRVYEEFWNRGGMGLERAYKDLLTNKKANETVSEFIRAKIPEIVNDPEVAKKLTPTYHYATKRPIIDTDYYETYNRENVKLVDIKESPIVEIAPNGVRTTETEYELDTLIFATGYDAITGALFNIDIRGKDGVALKEKWKNGADIKTYLSIANSGFPNFFMITGPESPAGQANNPVVIEHNVDWIMDCLNYLVEHGVDSIEASREAEIAWTNHVAELVDQTLYPQTPSWYSGENIEGKARGISLYTGGAGKHREICDEVAERGYEGFVLTYSKDQITLQ